MSYPKNPRENNALRALLAAHTMTIKSWCERQYTPTCDRDVRNLLILLVPAPVIFGMRRAIGRGMTRTQETETMASTTHHFPTSKIAWDFMRQCDARGRCAGYPSLKPDRGGRYTVEVELLECPPPATASTSPVAQASERRFDRLRREMDEISAEADKARAQPCIDFDRP